jgi:hypothetical protein
MRKFGITRGKTKKAKSNLTAKNAFSNIEHMLFRC